MYTGHIQYPNQIHSSTGHHIKPPAGYDPYRVVLLEGGYIIVLADPSHQETDVIATRHYPIRTSTSPSIRSRCQWLNPLPRPIRVS